MEFRIVKGDTSRALYLSLANLGITVIIALLVIVLGNRFENIDTIDLAFEAASGGVAFLLFVAAAKVTVTGAKMNWLLIGLFLFQSGSLIDALDEIAFFDSFLWSVAGDAVRLAGEITLAAVALLFIRFTNKIASTDRLTNLYNKAFHVRWIKDYLSKSKYRLAVISIDLDKFKMINDVHGHVFGDSVLKHIGEQLAGFMRVRRGIASRTGGEEFELTLKSASEQSALNVAEQVRSLIEQNPPAGIDSVTASIGVALSTENETAEALRKRADAAAYLSKQSGRNRVSLAGDNQTLSSVEQS